MKTTTITHNGLEYLAIELEPINQKGKIFYLAKVSAVDFLKVYTVRPAQYDLEKHSALANSFPEEIDYYNHLINEDKINIKEKDFQREANRERVSGIKTFLEQEEFAFFPNTIIANCELINDWETYEIDSSDNLNRFFEIETKPSYLSFHLENEGKHILYVPKVLNSILVIDGQHRLEGLKTVTDTIKDEYDLVIAFIIGYDRSVIAKQFYTINYEQKAVNKSLLYQLTGEFSRDINEISYLHNVVKILNEIEDSPFYKRVKMLGVTPKNYNEGEKSNLSISQAFLIDSMLRFISPQAKGTNYPPIFLKFYKNSSQHIIIVKTLARFFTAVKNLKNDWNEPENSILSKGMGVGALMKVLNLIYPLIFKDQDSNWTVMSDLKAEDYETYLDGIQNVNFYSNGPYGKSGSGGTMNKIKEDIIMSLTYWESHGDYKQFELTHRIKFLEFSSQLN